MNWKRVVLILIVVSFIGLLIYDGLLDIGFINELFADIDYEFSLKLKKQDNIGIFILFIAGMVDGINPCALSMLIFFIMYISANKNKNNIIGIGAMFSLGTFIAYYFSGIGLLRVSNFFLSNNEIKFLIFAFNCLLSIGLLIFNLYDFNQAKKLEVGKIKLQLPKGLKKFTIRLIKKGTKYRAVYISSFILGFVTTIPELLCTGQVYLTTLLSIINLDPVVRNLYLLVFNIGFIIPIMVIVVLIHYGKKIDVFSDVLYSKLWVIKIITAVFMLMIFMYSFYSLLNL